ncbi:MAG: multiple sugar transport system permease protein [Gaiellales bacterium]|nr:multiple sugar transport system permease protein [Gaiellales bacterium]
MATHSARTPRAAYERTEWTWWSGLARGTKWIALVGGAVLILLPFAWMLGTSFKPESDVFGYPLRLQPTHPTLSNYTAIWRELPFTRLVLNSVVFAGGVTIFSVFFDSLAAYALARLRFPGRTIAFYLVLATLMVPFQVTLVPLFQLVFRLHWLNTYQGLIIPRATSAFGIFLLRQFFVSIPRELDEAARIDGASEWHIYRRIMLPLAKPALATLAIFYFMNNWNDFLWPLVITTGTNHENLPAGLTLFSGQYVIQHGVLMAGATISLLPLAVAFLLAQRYFVRGVATTGIK